MSKDDLETQCMNELFGTREKMIAKIYVKSQDDVTSILVASKGNVYFHDVLSGRIAHRDLNVHRVGVEVTLCRADPHARRGIILKVAHIDVRLTFQPL